MLALLALALAPFAARRAARPARSAAAGEPAPATAPETHAERLARIQARCEAFAAAHPAPSAPVRGKNYIRPEHRARKAAEWQLRANAEPVRGAR